MSRDAMTDEVAIFVIEQKAFVHQQHPQMSEDHIKDEVMMRLAREVMASRPLTHGEGVEPIAEPSQAQRSDDRALIDELRAGVESSMSEAANRLEALGREVEEAVGILRGLVNENQHFAFHDFEDENNVFHQSVWLGNEMYRAKAFVSRVASLALSGGG